MGSRKTTHDRPPILPAPKRLTKRAGEFRLRTGTAIQLPTIDSADRQTEDRKLFVAASQAKQEIFDRTGIDICIEAARHPDSNAGSIICRIDPNAALEPRRATARDAYHLEVRAKRVLLSAPTADGIRHGLQTFCQLIKHNGRVSSIDIVDQPDFLNRGIMLDVSRGKVPTQETLKGLVELCCRLRLNVLMLYIEHTFEFRRHPEIGRDSSPLTAEALLELDLYAAEHGVELIPCLQSLGHMERVLGIDRYAHLAESDRRWSLSPSRPETYQFLEQLYDEFLPLFSSRRFNANCDEPFDLGRGQSARLAPGKDAGRLFSDHIHELNKLSRRHRKQLMIWADFAHAYPRELSSLDSDIVLLDWWYEENFDADRVKRLRPKKFEAWVCPGTSSWNCLFPRVANSMGNIERWSRAGQEHGATGLLNTDWGDFGHYNALGVSFQSYAWGAQHAWSGHIEVNVFDQSFSRHVFGEPNAKIGRLYRSLGAIHQAGFRIANGSPLQSLYFDNLGASFFLQHGRKSALEASARKLEPILRKIRGHEFTRPENDFIGLARQELAWAAEATRLSVNKGLAAIEFNNWRSDPSRLPVAGRRRLALKLDGLAAEQAEQLGRLRTLWLARSEISDFQTTQKRIRRSIAALRTGARQLRKNVAPRPAKASQLSLLAVYDHVRKEMGMRPR
jgi:hypothetical protein